jgi:hypothetical protein
MYRFGERNTRRIVFQKIIFWFLFFRKSLPLESVSGFRSRANQYVPLQIFSSMQNFIKSLRNIPRRDFVYAGAAVHSAVQGGIQKKPRGGSRGVLTRSFSGR